MPEDPERRLEPWPLALAAALLLMIGVCVGFYAIAASHPDPLVTQDPRPGLER